MVFGLFFSFSTTSTLMDCVGVLVDDLYVPLSFLIVFKRINFHSFIYTLFSPVLIGIWIVEEIFSKSNDAKCKIILSRFRKIFISLIFIPNFIVITSISIEIIYATFLNIPIIIIISLFLFSNFTIMYVLMMRKELLFNISYDKIKFIFTYFLLLHIISFTFDFFICLL